MTTRRRVVPVGISSAARSRVGRAGGATALALALVGTPVAAFAAGSNGSGVPAKLRAHNTDGWWYRVMELSGVQKYLDGAGVTVAVIDNSIDTAAPELRGAHITLGRSCGGAMTKSRPVNSQNADAPGGVHGTSMAAFIVGQGHGSGPGGSGILGLAPKANLLFYGNTTENGRFCSDATLIRAAAKAGASIISISSGSTTDVPDVRSAVQWAEKNGVVVVASAGDTGGRQPSSTVVFPAGDPGVVAVNAVNRAAKPWGRNPAPTEAPASDGSPAVDAFPVISAPGVHTNALMWSLARGFVSTAWGTGTSPATAITAGALALVKQKYPAATGNQLIQDLIHNPGGTQKYSWNRSYGFGILSVPNMLAQDATKWPDVNPLLNGPDAAVKNFPTAVYGHPAAATSAKPTVKTSSTKSSSGTSGSQTTGGGGMPVWLWGLIAVIVAGAAGLGAKLGLSKRQGPGNASMSEQ